MNRIRHERSFVRRGRRVAILALALAVAAAVSNTFAVAPVTKNIEIAKFAFVPKEITIEPGTRLRWTNHDETPHTVTSQAAKKVLSSPGLDLKDHYEFVFNEEADYPYLCTVHPMMAGIVHVRKSGSKAP